MTAVAASEVVSSSWTCSEETLSWRCGMDDEAVTDDSKVGGGGLDVATSGRVDGGGSGGEGTGDVAAAARAAATAEAVLAAAVVAASTAAFSAAMAAAVEEANKAAYFALLFSNACTRAWIASTAMVRMDGCSCSGEIEGGAERIGFVGVEEPRAGGNEGGGGNC
jgi:hypothetical protein